MWYGIKRFLIIGIRDTKIITPHSAQNFEFGLKRDKVAASPNLKSWAEVVPRDCIGANTRKEDRIDERIRSIYREKLGGSP